MKNPIPKRPNRVSRPADGPPYRQRLQIRRTHLGRKYPRAMGEDRNHPGRPSSSLQQALDRGHDQPDVDRFCQDRYRVAAGQFFFLFAHGTGISTLAILASALPRTI